MSCNHKKKINNDVSLQQQAQDVDCPDPRLHIPLVEPRDSLWREMGDLYIQGDHLGRLPKSRSVCLGKE